MNKKFFKNNNNNNLGQKYNNLVFKKDLKNLEQDIIILEKNQQNQRNYNFDSK